MSAAAYGWIVLAFPLAGTVVTALGWRALPGRAAGWIATAAILGSFLAGLGALQALLALPPAEQAVTSSLYDYARGGGIAAGMEILVDPLSLTMVLAVSGVSFAIHLYSVAYLASDRGYARFFAYMNFFVLSMLLLVLAANFVLLIIGWAFVGAASYLLISFWYRRTTATAAGIKAFVVNVVGDIGLVVGVFLLFQATGALDYAGVFARAEEVFGHDDATIVIACLLLLVGAFAKSAQVPLHTWLPDAMEGPTPVSALIHAATMVTAGVYLIARMHPLFEIATAAAAVAAVIGTLTIFIAATIACVMTDLKRSIAYSTMSQIGYMVLGVAAFGWVFGLFHLITHAFFKALLFMGAGSVIGAMGGEQSMDRMGGFRRALPFTFVTFTIGALALAGFPLTAGWLSKDSIIDYVLHRGGLWPVLAIVGYVGALLTAFYSFRMVFRVFFGEPCPEAAELERGHVHHGEGFNPATGEAEDSEVGFPGPEHHFAERAWPMRLGMAPLALLAIAGGALAIPGVSHVLANFLGPSFGGHAFAGAEPSVAAEWLGLAIGGAISVAGIAIAWFVYIARPGTAAAVRERAGALYTLLANKWYFDEAIDAVFVRPALALGRFGRDVVESELVQGAIVGGATSLVRAGSGFARALQSGYLRGYALLLAGGAVALTVYFLIVAG